MRVLNYATTVTLVNFEVYKEISLTLMYQIQSYMGKYVCDELKIE